MAYRGRRLTVFRRRKASIYDAQRPKPLTSVSKVHLQNDQGLVLCKKIPLPQMTKDITDVTCIKCIKCHDREKAEAEKKLKPKEPKPKRAKRSRNHTPHPPTQEPVQSQPRQDPPKPLTPPYAPRWPVPLRY